MVFTWFLLTPTDPSVSFEHQIGDISDDFSMNTWDKIKLDIRHALYGRALHVIYNEIDITILYNDIFSGQ